MSASAASPAPSPSINVIVSIHENEPAVQLKFLSERLNWDHLVSFIQSSSTLEPPMVLYYKLTFDTPVEALENQEHLSQLLSALDSPSSLRFYGHQEHVVSPVFVSSTAAFTRLGALVDQHKHVLKSSRRLSRWVGILASMMATSDRSFDHEFQVLESLIQRKTLKLERRSGNHPDKKSKKTDLVETDGVISAGEDEEFTESPEVIDLDARLDDMAIGGRPGFGGHHFGRGGRGRHCHPPFYGFLEGCPSGVKNDKYEQDRQASAQFYRDLRHLHNHDRPRSPHSRPSSDSEGEAGFGGFGRGKHHHHHRQHHQNSDRPHPPHGGPSRGSEGEAHFGRCGRGKHQHHHHGKSHPYGGPRPFDGPFPFAAPSDSEEGVSGPSRGKHSGCRGGFGFGPGVGHRGAPFAFGSDEEPFGCRGFGGPVGFGGFGGHHGSGKHGKDHLKQRVASI
ncbi:unnamed protein product [Mucor fragilis]